MFECLILCIGNKVEGCGGNWRVVFIGIIIIEVIINLLLKYKYVFIF